MLDKARALVAERIEWQLGDVYRLLFAEVARVCRSNGRVVLCDCEASPIQPQNGRLAGLATKDFRGHAAAAPG